MEERRRDRQVGKEGGRERPAQRKFREREGGKSVTRQGKKSYRKVCYLAGRTGTVEILILKLKSNR